jgi:hypothetical protein
MHFEKHLFISYSHIDNQSQSPEKGWVTRFHSSLAAFVSMRLGEKAEIWRDDKLGGSDIFAKEILESISPNGLALVRGNAPLCPLGLVHAGSQRIL